MPKIARELTALQVKNLKNPGLHAVGGVPGLLIKIGKSVMRRCFQILLNLDNNFGAVSSRRDYVEFPIEPRRREVDSHCYQANSYRYIGNDLSDERFRPAPSSSGPDTRDRTQDTQLLLTSRINLRIALRN